MQGQPHGEKKRAGEMQLTLVKQYQFNALPVDVYQGSRKELYASREQAGRALGYVNPRKAIKDIHRRHADRLNPLSITFKVDKGDGANCAPLGGEQDTVMYTLRGLMEICRWSRQPQAHAFIDFCWDVMEGLYTGEAELRWKAERENGKALRRELTDIIAANPNRGKWDVKQYTDLAYKVSLGKTARQIRQERGEGNTRDLLTADELPLVGMAERRIGALYEMGLEYGEIKAIVTRTTPQEGKVR